VSLTLCSRRDCWGGWRKASGSGCGGCRRPRNGCCWVAAAEPTGDPVLLWRAAGRLGIGMAAAAAAKTDGLLTIGRKVIFRHPLVRSAAYRAASPEERRAAHQALAGATDPRADPDRRAWHRAQAAAGPDEEVASELEQSAGRAQARGGFAAAAAFLERSAALTPGQARGAERALAAAHAKYQAGAFDAALGLLAAAEAGPLDELQRARSGLLHGQIAFASSRGNDAPPLLLKAARRFEPLNPWLARDTYLQALVAALYASSLATAADLQEVAEAARAAPPPGPPRPADLLLDGIAVLITEGYPAGAPMLTRALSAFRAGDISPEEGLRWLWQACHAAGLVWDFDSWQVLSDRWIKIARDAGAVTALPLAFNMRAMQHVFAGEFTAATSLVAQVESVSQAIGISVARYPALALAVFRGREAEAAELIATAATDAERRGEGAWLPFVRWATAVLCNSLGHYEKALAAAQQGQPVLHRRTPHRCQVGGGRTHRGCGAQRDARTRGRRPAAALADHPRKRHRLGTWHRGPIARPGQRRRRCRGLLLRGHRLPSAAPHCTWTLAAPICCMASGCAASGVSVTPGTSCAAPTSCSPASAWQRSPSGRGSSCARPARTRSNAPPGHPTS